MTTADLHTLTGVYALHALSDRESAEFDRHLAVCPACTVEVRELRETAARLALAAAETPPPEFRARVLTAVSQVRQLPPLVPDSATPGSPWRRWRQRLPQLALAACLVVALVAVGVAVDVGHQLTRQRSLTATAQQQAATLSQLLAAPDAAFHSGQLTGGGTSTVVSSARLGQVAFVYHDLPGLADGKVYELWYSRGGVMVPAGLVDSSPSGGAKLLNGSPGGAAGVGVTVEPAGGSPRPTTAPILLAPLPQA
ncbi:anti-sigma factor domain-containing protein [Streptacidiphilus sp. P02-A3a]|uniref:anti-sigma factor n=1 Tax=Streptacidiphilus sp. P02-A3a TaxID=2704468 RepID=UPI0015FA3D6A|nr:anti-sigma factor [Streptacidiphilus sp. P02-A3a]QMU73189.1 anti-sigma factor [Streptacidiphilus sp. P02-A3a]